MSADLDDQLIRLECLKLVIPKDPAPDMDAGLFIARAKALEEFEIGTTTKHRQPRIADKPKGPAKTAGKNAANEALNRG